MKTIDRMTYLIVFLVVCILSSAVFVPLTPNSALPPVRNPRIVVFNGNGAYRTAVEDLVGNASMWGYNVIPVNILDAGALSATEMLILNGNDYLTDEEINLVEDWYNSGNNSIWFVGESDYGGLWVPVSLNVLSVRLGLNIIIQDDAVFDPEMNVGATYYKPVANETNVANEAMVNMTGIEDIFLYTPTNVVPYVGGEDGNGTMSAFGSISTIDWLVNYSAAAAIQDQDQEFDNDSYWEGVTPLTVGQVTAVAVEWEAGTSNGSKAIWTGETIFSDPSLYNPPPSDLIHQNMELTRSLFDWAISTDPVFLDTITTNTIVTVYNGNGAYHDKVNNFKGNASEWGYFVQPVTILDHETLLTTDILILNANDFLTEEEIVNIEAWWNKGERYIWFIGESDYGGLWNPASLNQLSVRLGLNLIIQDDAVVYPNVDGYTVYPRIANETNFVNDAMIDMTGIENISLHGPTLVVPYAGDEEGNGTMPAFDSFSSVDWLVNYSAAAEVSDGDFDTDIYWEGIPPFTAGQCTGVAVEWNVGPNNDSKAVFAGESFFADYKGMFGTELLFPSIISIQNIQLTQTLLEWCVPNPYNLRDPNVLVFNGNGAYHVKVDNFIGNATTWGYNVLSAMTLTANVLDVTEILILNANDYLTDGEIALIELWWKKGKKSIWFIGESDYGGLWNPASLNRLSVRLGLNLIIQDDAVNQGISGNEIIMPPLANETNFVNDAMIDMTGIENISLHGPALIVPYAGDEEGDGTMPAFDSILSIDWLINYSAHLTVMDQDFDSDIYWEGIPPLTVGNCTAVAVEWNAGPNHDSKAVFAGESFFADYKGMFGTKLPNHDDIALQNIQLTENLLNFCDDGLYSDFMYSEDYAAPLLMDIDFNYFESDMDMVVFDNEQVTIDFTIHDLDNSFNGLGDASIRFTVNEGDLMVVSANQISFSCFIATIGPFNGTDEVEFYIAAIDTTGWTTISETFTLNIEYSDTIAPIVDTFTITSANIDVNTDIIVDFTVTDVADVDQVISGLDSLTLTIDVNGVTTDVDITGLTSYNLGKFTENDVIVLTLTAYDMAGNMVESSPLAFTVADINETTTCKVTSSEIPGFTALNMLLILISASIFLRSRKRR